VKVSTERLPESQVRLEIEVDDERLEKAKESAYRRLAKKAKVPGFRPGKAPRAVLERHLGPEIIRQEAIDRLMPEVYREALEQEDLDPIDRAEYELVTEEPLVASFTVPVRPTVDLGNYEALRLPREAVTVEPERVQEGLEALRHRYATLEPVSRPIQWGDIIRADVHGTLEDGTVIVQDEDAEFQLLEERPIALPGFSDGLLGREKGSAFDFEATTPEDHPDERVRGSKVTYSVNVKELKQEVLPELDDEFAQQVGEGFPTLADLRSRIEADLLQALENEATHRHQDETLDALAERATLEYPPVLVEREIDRLIEEQSSVGRQAQAGSRTATNQREELDRYLQRIGKSEEEARTELHPVAETRVRRSLVLSELREAEHIEVSDAEVAEEIERLASGAGNQADEFRRLFSSDGAKDSLRRSLMTKKTLDRLVQIASDGAALQEAQASTSQEA
jgi:trigger factor